MILACQTFQFIWDFFEISICSTTKQALLAKIIIEQKVKYSPQVIPEQQQSRACRLSFWDELQELAEMNLGKKKMSLVS